MYFSVFMLLFSPRFCQLVYKRCLVTYFSSVSRYDVGFVAWYGVDVASLFYSVVIENMSRLFSVCSIITLNIVIIL
jgi:hypothetical protein